MQNPQNVKKAVDVVQDALGKASGVRKFAVGLVLGTGLSDVAQKIFEENETSGIAFRDIPNFPTTSVASHMGAFLGGIVNEVPVVAQLGRCHLYEGWTPADVCMGVRIMAGLGVEAIIFTNAAGALNPFFKPGSLMCINDQINYTGLSPLTGDNCEQWGERFPDMSMPFDPELREIAHKRALQLGIALENGVYIGVHGPEMETPAETRMYRQWGADAIGMSTVLEVIAARHCGVKVLGISCITNRNLPDCMEPAPLEIIIEAGQRAGKGLESLLPLIFQDIGAYTKN